MNKIYDVVVIKFGRERAYLNGELVGLGCKVCNEVKALCEFNNKKNGFAGKRSICKKCNSKKALAWNKDNRERKRQYNNKYGKQYCLDKPHKMIAYTQNWRAKQVGTEAKLTDDMTDTLLASAGFKLIDRVKLARCQLTGTWTSDFHTCHVEPLKLGGNSDNGNLFIATRQVNVLQGNTHLFEWIVSEPAKELVNEEYVQWLLRDLSHRKMVNIKTMLVNEVGLKTAKKVLRIYFPDGY